MHLIAASAIYRSNAVLSAAAYAPAPSAHGTSSTNIHDMDDVAGIV